MLSNFFIDRPVFTWVMCIMITAAGILATVNLPIQQYPQIAPPEVVITTTYPGASADTADKTVTQLIEQKLLAIDNLRYFSSSSSANGSTEVRLTFNNEADADIAQVQTQNKLSQAIPTLPPQVQALGLPVEKATRAFGLIVAFYADDDSISQDDLGDFVASKIREPIGRIKGVGQITPFAPQHSLRIWLNPDKLLYYKLTAQEVIAAITDQNAQLASGQLGATPAVDKQQINAPIVSQTLFDDPKQFDTIILRTLQDGSVVYLKDVARIEVGAENYESIRRYNGKAAAGFGVSLANKANALETIEEVKKRVEEFKPLLPKGVKVAYPIDVAPFIRLSVDEVIETLIIAVALVLLVMYVFLQSWRITLIPGLAIPVVIMGTFGCLALFGYSINLLTLFAMVLAIGMLVDDAIVVAENVKRQVDEGASDVKQATRDAMKELSGALIGTTAVIFAVFVPMAFFSGSTGIIYRQFSLTIVSSMALSLLVALSLSPVMCVTLLKPKSEDDKKEGRFFKRFNAGYDWSAKKYEGMVRWTIEHAWVSMAAFGVICAITIVTFLSIPTTFLPDEDQGRIFSIIEGPEASTFGRMDPTVRKVENLYLEKFKGTTDGLFTVMGYNFAGRGQNQAAAFINLKDYEKRKDEISVFDVAADANKAMAGERDARITFVTPPAIQDLGNAKGFEFQVTDEAGLAREQFVEARDAFIKQLASDKSIQYARLNALRDVPQYKVDIDYHKAKSLGLSVQDVNTTMTAAWGNMYLNNFLENGRVKRVFVQGDSSFRMNPADVGLWYVKNANGDMVSFADFAQGKWIYGAPQLQRFNGYPSFEVQGEPAAGVSTGEAIKAIESAAKRLPKGMRLTWTGLSYEEIQSEAQVVALYLISLAAVFLSLAALYESWSIPFAILLGLPLGIFGSAVSVKLLGLSNDIYFKVGFLLTMGLVAKNAILIVEFAEIQMREGKSAVEAALESCRQRFRPILMTSFTFILGVLPLVVASGPGSGSQNAIGTTLFGGIVTNTFLIIFFAPLFFVLILKAKEKVSGKEAVEPAKAKKKKETTPPPIPKEAQGNPA